MFSKEKQALVEMAKADKNAGMTAADMQAYKDLNKKPPYLSRQTRSEDLRPISLARHPRTRGVEPRGARSPYCRRWTGITVSFGLESVRELVWNTHRRTDGPHTDRLHCI